MPHILICDDEENIRRLIRKYAEFEGYTVSEAANGMQALSLCAANRYDAMLEAFAAMVRGEEPNPYTPDYELTLYKTLLECCK